MRKPLRDEYSQMPRDAACHMAVSLHISVLPVIFEIKANISYLESSSIIIPLNNVYSQLEAVQRTPTNHRRLVMRHILYSASMTLAYVTIFSAVSSYNNTRSEQLSSCIRVKQTLWPFSSTGQDILRAFSSFWSEKPRRVPRVSKAWRKNSPRWIKI